MCLKKKRHWTELSSIIIAFKMALSPACEVENETWGRLKCHRGNHVWMGVFSYVAST